MWCEWNKFGQRVLKHHFPQAEGFGDISTTDFKKYANRIDVLTGGFPCQDASRAKQWGKGQEGLQGKRTGLYWHMLRAIDEIRPKYAVAENVADIVKINEGRDFAQIPNSLYEIGYDAEWRCFYAADIGAPHKRERMYMVIYPNGKRLETDKSFFSFMDQETEPKERRNIAGATVSVGKHWQDTSSVLRIHDGVPVELDGITLSKWHVESIQAYGNAIVPQVAHEIFKSINDHERRGVVPNARQ